MENVEIESKVVVIIRTSKRLTKLSHHGKVGLGRLPTATSKAQP